MPSDLKNSHILEVSITQYDISVIPNDFNILTINQLIESQGIEMPFFQRNYIWDKKRASRFIESLVLGLPIPQVFLYQKERNKFIVIDGQQRLLTIYYFIKQRFPLTEKRVALRKVFDEYGYIPNDILFDDQYFQDFKLQFPKLESGEKHTLDGLKYNTLGIYKSNFEFMTMRCMTVKQNDPKDDDSSIFEIFNRLNTGGVNLTAQEIRGCLYYSKFYNMLYNLNKNKKWRQIWGKKEEDNKSKDIEVLLRVFALLCNYENYRGSMASFINRFAKKAMEFEQSEVEYFESLFLSYMDACSSLSKAAFSTKTGSFNAALFESVFIAAGENPYKKHELISLKLELNKINDLKKDPEFDQAITHSTSHTKSVMDRIKKAKEYLL